MHLTVIFETQLTVVFKIKLGLLAFLRCLEEKKEHTRAFLIQSHWSDNNKEEEPDQMLISTVVVDSPPSALLVFPVYPLLHILLYLCASLQPYLKLKL